MVEWWSWECVWCAVCVVRHAEKKTACRSQHASRVIQHDSVCTGNKSSLPSCDIQGCWLSHRPVRSCLPGLHPSQPWVSPSGWRANRDLLSGMIWAWCQHRLQLASPSLSCFRNCASTRSSANRPFQFYHDLSRGLLFGLLAFGPPAQWSFQPQTEQPPPRHFFLAGSALHCLGRHSSCTTRW